MHSSQPRSENFQALSILSSRPVALLQMCLQTGLMLTPASEVSS